MRTILTGVILLASIIGASAEQFYITQRDIVAGKLYLHFVPPNGDWVWKTRSRGAAKFSAKWARHTVGELSGPGGCGPRRERVR